MEISDIIKMFLTENKLTILTLKVRKLEYISRQVLSLHYKLQRARNDNHFFLQQNYDYFWLIAPYLIIPIRLDTVKIDNMANLVEYPIRIDYKTKGYYITT
jgi:hypothetical protein